MLDNDTQPPYFPSMPITLQVLDISGAVFSLLSTIFYVRTNWRAWPLGIVATVLNSTLYGLSGIYGDMTLEGIYFISMFYGWYLWIRRGKNHHELDISHITWRLILILSAIAVIGIFIVAELLKNYTNSQIPYLDAVATVLSLIAQWLICKKILETWFLWFIADSIYVGLYFYKGIPAHSFLLLIYLVLAVAGYIHWRRLLD